MSDSDNAYPIVIENSKLKEENARLREALGDFLGLAATCNQINQPEWMEYFVENINKCCELLGGDDRAIVNERGNISIGLKLGIAPKGE